MKRTALVMLLAGCLSLGLLGSLGCFVFEELDKSQDLMENPRFGAAPAPKKEKTRSRAAARAPTKERDAPSAVAARLKSWWEEEARTLSSEKVDEDLVQCELSGRTHFMRRSDCLARGGEPERPGR